MFEKIKNKKIPTVTSLLFSETQRSILKECKVVNAEDNFQWLTKNVILPIVIIFIPLFIQLIFPTGVKDFKTLIFNGSISLLGINILFGMSTYLIKVNNVKKSQKEDGEEDNEKINEKLNQDVVSLRGRLDDYKNILVFIGGVFYVTQALFGEYNSETFFYTFLITTLLIFFLSIKIGRYMFIIKDDFFERTFYGEMNSAVSNARARWEKKY